MPKFWQQFFSLSRKALGSHAHALTTLHQVVCDLAVLVYRNRKLRNQEWDE